MKVGAYIIVKGLVQGVGFRWFVEREAKGLGLSGYVKNLYNGDVEVEVEGDKGLIEDLVQQLRLGNRSSHVTGVQVSWKEYEDRYTSFRIAF